MTVVPTLAPIITPTDWLRLISPALMNPTTSTVVTEEDWMTAVTKAPVIAAVNRFLVNRASSAFMPSPAAALSPSDMVLMP